jgi:hypothetical protein
MVEADTLRLVVETSMPTYPTTRVLSDDDERLTMRCDDGLPRITRFRTEQSHYTLTDPSGIALRRQLDTTVPVP